jgi:hypothetical protein
MSAREIEEKQAELAILQARLERGLAVLAEATGCDDAEAERLLAHWDAVNAEFVHLVDSLRALERALEGAR